MTSPLGHWGMLGGNSTIYVPPEEPEEPASGWTEPLQYDAPAGWESYPEIIVEPSTNVQKDATTGAWGIKTISLSAGQNRKIVMPMPGDALGNTTHRKGKVTIQGGGNLVFCVKKAGVTTTYRRGGFCIEIPRYTPYLATATACPPSNERKALDLMDNGQATTGRIIDIVGMFTTGTDNHEGITTNGKATIYQIQRSRIWSGRYRCAADRAGPNGLVNDGYSSATTNPYRNNAENVHCDCIQCYKDGYKEIRVHDSTFLSGMGVFTLVNDVAWDGSPVVHGEVYLSRFNVEPFYFATPETLNNFNTGYANQGRNQGTRWYWAVSGSGDVFPKRVWVDDDVYFGRNEIWNPSNGDPQWPGRGMLTMQIPSSAFSVYDTITDVPRRLECNANSRIDGQLCMRRWTRTPGGGIAGTKFGTKAQFRIGDPPGGSYALASMWGGDGNSYVE